MTRQIPTTVLMRGGVDLETPLIASKPGSLLLAVNYEPTDRGYRRFAGYERYDGSVLPHQTTYALLRFDNGSVEIAEGDTVAGGTSGHTGIAVIDAILESGSYGGGDAAGYVILSKSSPFATIGPFVDGEDLEVSASKVAEADGAATPRGAATQTLDQTYLQAAADYWRATISKPSGSEAIRGVHYYTDYTSYGAVVCFRDNAGGTAGQMFDNFAGTGWASVTLRHTLGFTANTVGQFAVGQTVTGGSSGATGVIQAVVRQSGTWGTNAAGYLVLASISGMFIGETITAPGVSATSTGAQAAITLPPGGRYRFVNENVRATVDLKRMYFANGEGYAHEVYWNGSSLVVTPIRIPGLTAATDKPTHVAVFKNHLFLFYKNGVIRNSGIETPLEFIADGGAAEHGFGDEITDVVVSSSALIVFGRRKISYFIGSSAADFQLIPISPDTGASPDSVQMVDTPYYFDGQMIRRLTSTEALGGWKMGAVAPEVAEYWRAQIAAGNRVLGSYRVQKRNQYVFFMGSGIFAVVYLGRKRAEVGFLQLPDTMTCSTEIDHTEGLFTEDVVLCGGDDGHVYLMDVGRSFDGASGDVYFLMSPISVAGVRRNHRWHKGKVSIVPEGLVAAEPVTLGYAAFYSFASNVTPYQLAEIVRDDLGSPAGLPGNLAGIAQFLAGNEATIDLDGFGHNIALLFADVNWAGTPAYTIDSITFYTTPRRQEG